MPEALLTRTRLLTLSGIGGLGKTRLALQIAGERARPTTATARGSWISRDPTTARLCTSEAAKVLGVREEPGRPMMQTLCANSQDAHAR